MVLLDRDHNLFGVSQGVFACQTGRAPTQIKVPDWLDDTLGQAWRIFTRDDNYPGKLPPAAERIRKHSHLYFEDPF